MSLWRKRQKKNGQYIDQNVSHDRQNHANLSEMEVITTNLLDKKKPLSYTKRNFPMNIPIGS